MGVRKPGAGRKPLPAGVVKNRFQARLNATETRMVKAFISAIRDDEGVDLTEDEVRAAVRGVHYISKLDKG